MTDVLALSIKIAKLLDPIAQEHRATVLQLLRERYQIGPMTGAARTRRWRYGDDDTVTVSDDIVTLSESPNGANAPASRVFAVPASVLEALGKSRILGKHPPLLKPGYWQAEVRANPGVNFAAEILKAEAWMVANPERAPRKNYARFLHTWLARAERSDA